MTCSRAIGLLWLTFAVSGGEAFGEDRTLHRFERQRLTETYYAEGANAGDLNRDGAPDVVCGPYWYAGPDFTAAHEIYPPVPQPLESYADNFFNWVYDFNQDGWNDVLVVGLPGRPAFVFENPQAAEGHWPRRQVFDSVGNESPHFVDITGDERPELVCVFAGRYGYATFDPSKPLEKWTFHPVTDESGAKPFGHGLGVGDLNGDDLNDLLCAEGWYEQPASGADSGSWEFHAVKFTDSYGGAQMYVYDVDGDGDNDVVTSLAAHDYGLAWYEQQRVEGESSFTQHLIMGDSPEKNRYGLVVSELHSVALADMDGDGLKDIVTGKTYWSHHKGSPMWDAGAVVYWFRLERTPQGVQWTPYLIDDDAGVGRQLTVADVNHDQQPDVIVGGMKGGHVLIQRRTPADEAAWQAAQPKWPLSKWPAVAPVPVEGRNAGDVKEITLKNVGLRLVWCPAGSFSMGSPASDAQAGPDEQPQVNVTLTSGFWLARTELKQHQWTAVMGTAPWSGKANVQEGQGYPATYVSWEDATTFCRTLTDQERSAGRLPMDWSYQLPTEAQWEYACRAGTTTKYSFEGDESQLSEYAWWGGDLDEGNTKTELYAHLAGLKKPNAWGLVDMHGNVWELCQDNYDKVLPGGRDPLVSLPSGGRIHRGGSWFNTAWRCRSAIRGRFSPDYRNGNLGFRLALSPSGR